MPFLPVTSSLQPTSIPTAQASVFILQYFAHYLWCSKCGCHLYWIFWMFTGNGFRTFLLSFVTIPVAPAIIGMMLRFWFHIRCTCIRKLLYFSFFTDFFCVTLVSAGIDTSDSTHVFYFCRFYCYTYPLLSYPRILHFTHSVCFCTWNDSG